MSTKISSTIRPPAQAAFIGVFLHRNIRDFSVCDIEVRHGTNCRSWDFLRDLVPRHGPYRRRLILRRPHLLNNSTTSIVVIGQGIAAPYNLGGMRPECPRDSILSGFSNKLSATKA
jgi:hypothetical protein